MLIEILTILQFKQIQDQSNKKRRLSIPTSWTLSNLKWVNFLRLNA